MLNIVLVEPEIPNNRKYWSFVHWKSLAPYTSFGFVINDKNLKRSGLDYWVQPDVTEYTDVNEWMNQVSDRSRFFDEFTCWKII
jgi:tRNA (cytidine/uridine-2'-O-)-methyltransferase